MLIVGHTISTDLTAADVNTDFLVMSPFTTEVCLLSKLTIAMTGTGSNNGDMNFRGVVYRDGALVDYTPTVTIDDFMEPAWIDFVFDTPVPLEAAEYWFGLQSGGADLSAQLTVADPALGKSYSADAAPFADGPPLTLTPTETPDIELGIFGSFAYEWTPPVETDLYLANLGYGSAQVALKGEGDRRTRRRVKAAWHGTSLDSQPQGASLAVVQRDGALSDLVGERLVLTSGSRSTIVYIHRETDLDLDDDTEISLSRRAWQALSPLATDELMVTAEVVGPAS